MSLAITSPDMLTGGTEGSTRRTLFNRAKKSSTSSEEDDEDARLDKIVELGKKALRQKRSDELASDLLGLDGVSLPLRARSS
jgi:hypothetical protein